MRINTLLPLLIALAGCAEAQTTSFTSIKVATTATLPGTLNVTSGSSNVYSFTPGTGAASTFNFGNTTFAVSILPTADNNSFLGSSSKRWNTLYAFALFPGSGNLEVGSDGGSSTAEGIFLLDASGHTFTVKNGLLYPPTSTLPSNGVLYQATGGYLQATAVGTSGQVLTSNGAGVAPTFQASAGGGGISGATSGQVIVATAATTGTSYSGLSYNSGTSILSAANVVPVTDDVGVLGSGSKRWNSVTTSQGYLMGPAAQPAQIAPFVAGGNTGLLLNEYNGAYVWKYINGLFYPPSGVLTNQGIIYQNSAGFLYSTAAGTTGQVLTSNGSSSAPTFQSVTGSVTSVATGTGLTGGPITTTGTVSLVVPVVVSSGGTGATTLTNHGVVIGQGTSAVHVTAAGTTGQVLTSQGASADPIYTSAGSGTVTSITAGTGLTGGTITGSGTIALSTPVSVPNGGTGATNFPTNNILFGTNTSAISSSTNATVDSSGNMTISSLAVRNNASFNPGMGVLGDTGATPIPVGTVGYFSGAGLNSSTPVALTSGVPVNVVSHSFPAGRFAIWGTVWYTLGSGATMTLGVGATSTGSATLPGQNTNAETQYPWAVSVVGSDGTIPISRHDYTFTTTTTIYEVSGANFSGGTCSTYGGMSWEQLP